MSNFVDYNNMTDICTATGTKIVERAKIFPGTKAEWDALPLSEKVKYDYVAFAGDSQSGVVDDVPTKDSENPVQSGGVYNSLDPVYNVLGAKNLLPNNAVSQTIDGLTFTVNSNGSIDISGANTGTAGSYSVSNEFLLKKGSYILSRGIHSTPCPSLYIAKTSDSSVIVELVLNSDTEEIAFTLDTDVKVKCYMWYMTNTAYDTTFYPMIRLASITDDTYVPYSMTNREMTPYVQAISNPNLLDNPWFTVNQRGQSSYSDTGYTVDRWKCEDLSDSGNTISVSDDGLVCTASGTPSKSPFVRQYFDGSVFDGSDFTISMLIESSVVTKTYLQVRTSDNTNLIDTSGVEVSANTPTIIKASAKVQKINGICYIRAFFNYLKVDNAVVKIKAIKLEKGSVSTLAMDTTPNYATELLKCQRYYQKFYFSAGIPIGLGYASGTTSARVAIPLLAPFRTAGNVAYTTSSIDTIVIYNNGTEHAVSELHAYVNQCCCYLFITTTGLTDKTPCIARQGTGAFTLEISADL